MKSLPISRDFVHYSIHKAADVRQPDTVQCSDELNRLLSAAIVNQSFCRKLLASPLTAINDGYCGYYFDLPAQEASILATIRSVSLDDFARQLINRLEINQTATASKQVRELEYSMVPTPRRREEVAIRP